MHRRLLLNWRLSFLYLCHNRLLNDINEYQEENQQGCGWIIKLSPQGDIHEKAHDKLWKINEYNSPDFIANKRINANSNCAGTEE
jgi:hypothetical protein